MAYQSIETLCVVIPMKSPQRAKQRLALSLSDEAREHLALRLFESSLAFFQQHFPRLDVLVVSESLEVLKMAQAYQANTLFDDGSGGLNGALAFACDWVKQSGYHSQLIVPGDIARLEADEITRLLTMADQSQVLIAVAKDGGTNALLTSPPDAIDFQYGHRSALTHYRSALQQQLSCRCVHLDHLALDIDHTEDLACAVLAQPERFKDWLAYGRAAIKERHCA